MQIWPAVDIAHGKCVRLRQGDFAQETEYGDPPDICRQWVRQGATCLHLVDLDGARSGQPEILELVARIADEFEVPCQLGGGMRTRACIDRALQFNIDRVVIGTEATGNNGWLLDALEAYPGRIAIGMDVRDGRVAVEGWSRTTDLSALEMAARIKDLPLAALIFTDIASDGMLQGPNWRSLTEMRSAYPGPLIASGGITAESDIRRLAELRFDGAIVGRAFYEGTLTLHQALAAANPSTLKDTVP